MVMHKPHKRFDRDTKHGVAWSTACKKAKQTSAEISHNLPGWPCVMMLQRICHSNEVEESIPNVAMPYHLYQGCSMAGKLDDPVRQQPFQRFDNEEVCTLHSKQDR